MLIIAHRSPASAQACAEMTAAGAHVFEVDVRLSGTTPVVSHYLDLPGTGGRVQRDNWRFRAGARAVTDRPLADQIEVIGPWARILLDLKERSAARRSALVSRLLADFPSQRFIVASPWPEDLETLRNAGWTTWRTVRNRSMLQLVLSAPVPDSAVTVRHTLLTAETVGRLHQWAAGVMAWTVDDVTEARRLRAAGVDGVTTDSLQVMRALPA